MKGLTRRHLFAAIPGLALAFVPGGASAEKRRETLHLTRHQLHRLENEITQHVTRRIVEKYLFHLGALDTRADAHAVAKASTYFESHPHEIAMILAVLDRLHLYEKIIEPSID